MNETLTAIEGIEVGHWTDPDAATGCTVISLPEPNCVTAEFRGAAPGTREAALLQPGMAVEQVQAILLTGGSAFGLSAADGVVRELEADGRGHPTLRGPVPIVPAAVVYDLHTGDPECVRDPSKAQSLTRTPVPNRWNAVGSAQGPGPGWRDGAGSSGLGPADWGRLS